MTLPIRRIAAAAIAAAALLTLGARPASADDRCGHVQCAIQIRAEAPSSLKLSLGWSPTENVSKRWTLDRKLLAVIEPGQAHDDAERWFCELESRCLKLKIHAQRLAGNAARVSVSTVLMRDNGPEALWSYLREQDLRPVTIASDATASVADEFDYFSAHVETKLRLSNAYVPFYG